MAGFGQSSGAYAAGFLGQSSGASTSTSCTCTSKVAPSPELSYSAPTATGCGSTSRASNGCACPEPAAWRKPFTWGYLAAAGGLSTSFTTSIIAELPAGEYAYDFQVVGWSIGAEEAQYPRFQLATSTNGALGEYVHPLTAATGDAAAAVMCQGSGRMFHSGGQIALTARVNRTTTTYALQMRGQVVFERISEATEALTGIVSQSSTGN